MSKTANRRTKVRKAKTAEANRGHHRVISRARSTIVDERPQFDKDAEHLPKSVIERQVERLIKKNKQALDELSKL